MKFIPVIFFVILLVGCDSIPKRRDVTTAPAVASIINAEDSATAASKIAKEAYKQGLQAGSKQAAELVAHLDAALLQLKQAQAQLDVAQKTIDMNNAKYDAMAEDLAKAQAKAAKADAAIWKRNAIIASLVALIGIWAALKFYFKIGFL
jgi:chromosome segregation ATPase